MTLGAKPEQTDQTIAGNGLPSKNSTSHAKNPSNLALLHSNRAWLPCDRSDHLRLLSVPTESQYHRLCVPACCCIAVSARQLHFISGGFGACSSVPRFFLHSSSFFFEVTNPLDVLALISFLTTGLVITRLTTKVREEAARSHHQRRQVGRLYELAQRLLALDVEEALLARSVELFHDVLDLRAVCLFDAAEVEIHCAGNSLDGLADEIPAAYSAGRDCEYVNSGILIRCLRAAGKTIGAIGFEGLREPELMAGPLSALAAAMLERAHTFRNASRAAAAAQAEPFRGAILDALAHEFKTPLATTVTAAGGLREVGPLRPEQLELADTVEEEAARLSSLASRLLRRLGFTRRQHARDWRRRGLPRDACGAAEDRYRNGDGAGWGERNREGTGGRRRRLHHKAHPASRTRCPP